MGIYHRLHHLPYNLQKSYPWVSDFPLGISINTVHPSFIGMDPFSHIIWIGSTSFSHWSGLWGEVELFSGYASLSHACRCYDHMCVLQLALLLLIRMTTALISTSVTLVWMGRPGGGWVFLLV